MQRNQAFPPENTNNSVNNQKNQTFTLGRLHKPNQSTFFGPTIYLLNRPRENTEPNNIVIDKDRFPIIREEKVLQQIKVLKQENERLKMQREQWAQADQLKYKEILRNQVQKMANNFEQNKLTWQQKEKKLNSQIQELKVVNSILAAKNEVLSVKLQQHLKLVEEVRLKERIKEQISEVGWMDTSRMQTSMQFNSSNLLFQKTTQKEVIIEKLKRCDQIIKDQKFIINTQREELNKEKLKQSDLSNFYEIEIDSLKKKIIQMQNMVNHINQERISSFDGQIKALKNKIIKLEEQVREKSQIVANQVQNISEKQQKFTQLEINKNIIQIDCRQRLLKIEEIFHLIKRDKQRQIDNLNDTVKRCLANIQSLKTNIQHYEEIAAQKQLQVEQITNVFLGILAQQRMQMNKIKNVQKQRAKKTKISKSLSVANVSFKRDFKTEVNLSQIFSSVVQLKSSNDRSRELMQKTHKAEQKWVEN